MRSRHWQLLSESIGLNVKPKAGLTFSRCLEMGLQEHMGAIGRVAEVAGKEFAIEQVGGRRVFVYFYLGNIWCILKCYILSKNHC